MSNLEKYYYLNQEEVELAWEDYLMLGEWGSGDDFVNPNTEERFWEFVEELSEKK